MTLAPKAPPPAATTATTHTTSADATVRGAGAAAPIALCGTVVLLSLLAASALSWMLAPFATYEGRTYGQFEFFRRFADTLPFIQGRLADGLSEWRWFIQLSLRSRGVFENRMYFLLAYSAPLIVASLGVIGLLWTLWRRRDRLGAADSRRLFAWGVAFAVVCVPAVPVLVPDFWLSVAWGRTLAAGINPYYEVPAAATSWLPLDAPIMRMTYGPLWAYVSAAIMKVTGGHALRGALLFKLVLLAAWVGLLALVRSLVRDRSPFAQCVALVMTAWIPIGVVQTVAEGHNDIAMVSCILLWLALLTRGRTMAATAALTASVLFKYASAPLFLVDFLYRRPDESRDPVRMVRSYFARGILAAVMTVAAFAPVFRGLDFFASTNDVHGGHFFLPSDAVLALGVLTHLPLRWLAYLVEAIFPVVTVLALYRYLRDGGTAGLRATAAAVMLSMLLVGSAHAWPWYVLWYLAVAATVPLSGHGRWATGLALALPYPLLVWTIAPSADDFEKFQLPSLLAYGLALGWLLVVRWRATGRDSSSTS